MAQRKVSRKIKRGRRGHAPLKNFEKLDCPRLSSCVSFSPCLPQERPLEVLRGSVGTLPPENFEIPICLRQHFVYFEGVHILHQTVKSGRYIHICGRINEEVSNNDNELAFANCLMKYFLLFEI